VSGRASRATSRPTEFDRGHRAPNTSPGMHMHTPGFVEGDLAAPLGGQGAAAMMALHPRSLSGLGRRASEVGCKVRSYFFPSGGTCLQSVCFEPCATLIRRPRRTPGRLDVYDEEMHLLYAVFCLPPDAGTRQACSSVYDHVICVSSPFFHLHRERIWNMGRPGERIFMDSRPRPLRIWIPPHIGG
jgi:hypothetical protein